jgi:hypothetical protein
VDESNLIVRGQVVSVQVQPHPQLKNLMTVVVTMNVSTTYKGIAQASLVFRQYILSNDSQDDWGYRKGQELILLLRPVSQYGLTSPAGMEQGRFEVKPAKNGQTTVTNGRGNFGLFDHIEEHAHARGLQLPVRSVAALRHPQQPLQLQDLEDLIRSFARSH